MYFLRVRGWLAARQKERVEGLTNSYSQTKGEKEGSTLVGEGEGEGVRCVSQGEPLMQEKTEIERKACTGGIRVEEAPTAIAHDLMVAKEAISNLPLGAGEDFEYDSEFEEGSDNSRSGEGGGEGPSTLLEMSPWLFSNSYVHNNTKVVIFRNYQRAYGEARTSNPLHATTIQNFVASLQLHQTHILQQRANTDDIKCHLDGENDAIERRVDAVAPSTSQRFKLDKLVKDMASLTATGVPQTLDDNKKGDSALVVSEPVTTSVQGVPSSEGETPQIIANPGEFQLTKVVPSPAKDAPAKDAQNFLNSESLIKESIFKAVTSSSSKFVPVHTIILKVLTPDTIILQKEYDAEHSCVKEFEPIFSGRTGSQPRHHGKNKLEVDYPFHKPDESKVLAAQIRVLKASTDVKLGEGMAVIYRNGKEIHITNSHPRFNEAKREEIARLRREANPQGFEKQDRLAQELIREMEEESSEAVEEEAPTKRKVKKRKTVPKTNPIRWKQRSNRHVSPEKVEEKKDTGRKLIFEDPIC
ncbi:hypothetical protein POM88_029193 [Heracleum sosnowskyi]|uniref:Uncharacterized protein n=1 Tax=Heracleum sosnowskyi TaxID=360622 RepID=A0AAD8HVX5_9APIA|nr:hypothetical protein POM88_029193 [Heracleum sosnowskyi]